MRLTLGMSPGSRRPGSELINSSGPTFADAVDPINGPGDDRALIPAANSPSLANKNKSAFRLDRPPLRKKHGQTRRILTASTQVGRCFTRKAFPRARIESVWRRSIHHSPALPQKAESKREKQRDACRRWIIDRTAHTGFWLARNVNFFSFNATTIEANPH